MSENRIEPGDYVEILFLAGERGALMGIVTYIPCDSGDCWHIRPVTLSGDAGWTGVMPIVYVQNFESIMLKRKALASKSDLNKMGE